MMETDSSLPTRRLISVLQLWTGTMTTRTQVSIWLDSLWILNISLAFSSSLKICLQVFCQSSILYLNPHGEDVGGILLSNSESYGPGDLKKRFSFIPPCCGINVTSLSVWSCATLREIRCPNKIVFPLLFWTRMRLQGLSQADVSWNNSKVS